MATRGQKRHLITLSNPGTAVPDGDGGYTEVPAALSPAQVWAEIKPAAARDLERIASAATVISTATHVVTIDYHPQVTTKTQVTFGSRVFDVTGVGNPEERNIDLVLVCQERVQ